MANRALDDATTLRIETTGAKPRRMTWREFCRDNADGDFDLLDVQDRLANAGRATLGGGAASFVTIIVEQMIVATPEPAAAPSSDDTPEMI